MYIVSDWIQGNVGNISFGVCPQLHRPYQYTDLIMVLIQKKWSQLIWQIHQWIILQLKLINNLICKLPIPKILIKIIRWIRHSLLHIPWCTFSPCFNLVFQYSLPEFGSQIYIWIHNWPWLNIEEVIKFIQICICSMIIYQAIINIQKEVCIIFSTVRRACFLLKP